MKILMLAVMFFVLSALFIVSEKNLSLGNNSDKEVFSKGYYSWLNKTFENSKSVAGFVVKMDWLPDKD